jgi:polysaccharide biosynthesis/export protein
MTIPFRLTLGLFVIAVAGCWTPLHSPAICANTLPDDFRVPEKALSVDLNYATLTTKTPDEYVLGPCDVIRVEIFELVPGIRQLLPPNLPDRQGRGPLSYSVDVRVAHKGDVMLPLVGSVEVGDMTLEQARKQIASAYAKGFIDDPRVAVSLVERATVRVMVLGEVAHPDVYELSKYDNDIAHAITKAGGLTVEAGKEIQVHRKVANSSGQSSDETNPLPPLAHPSNPQIVSEPQTIRIPRRTNSPPVLSPEQVTLNTGDVVVVPRRTDEVFYVVGKLNTISDVRFTVGKESRDLGNGFVLPRDRDIDVVTAVVMAGYIDPIDSPDTVTVHRTMLTGDPVLIHVDLIAARYDRTENIMVEPGDIIYVNPDAAWWFRRTLDRVLPELITLPYEFTMRGIFNQKNGK